MQISFNICVQHGDGVETRRIDAKKLTTDGSPFEIPNNEVELIYPRFQGEKKVENRHEVGSKIVLLNPERPDLVDRQLDLIESNQPLAIFLKKGNFQPKKNYKFPLFEINESDFQFCLPRENGKKARVSFLNDEKSPLKQDTQQALNTDDDVAALGSSSSPNSFSVDSQERKDKKDDGVFNIFEEGFNGVLGFFGLAGSDKVKNALKKSDTWLDTKCTVTRSYRDFIQLLRDVKNKEAVAKEMAAFLETDKSLDENINILLIVSASFLWFKMKHDLVAKQRPLITAIFHRVSAMPIIMTNTFKLTGLEFDHELSVSSQIFYLKGIIDHCSSEFPINPFLTKLIWLISYHYDKSIQFITNSLREKSRYMNAKFFIQSFDELYSFLSSQDMIFLSFSFIEEMDLNTFTQTLRRIRGDSFEIDISDNKKLSSLIMKTRNKYHASNYTAWKDFIDIIPKFSMEYRDSFYKALVDGNPKSLSWLMTIYDMSDASHSDINIILKYVRTQLAGLLFSSLSVNMRDLLDLLRHPLTDEFIGDVAVRESLIDVINDAFIRRQTVLSFQLLDNVHSCIQRNKSKTDADLNDMESALRRWISNFSTISIRNEDLSSIYQHAHENALFFKGLDRELQSLLARYLLPDPSVIFTERSLLRDLVCFPVEKDGLGDFFRLLVGQLNNIGSNDLSTAVTLHLNSCDHRRGCICYCCQISESIAKKAIDRWSPKSFLDVCGLSVETIQFIEKNIPGKNSVVFSCINDWIHRVESLNWKLPDLEAYLNVHSIEKEILIVSLSGITIPSSEDIKLRIDQYKAVQHDVSTLLCVNNTTKLNQLFTRDFNITLCEWNKFEYYILRYEKVNQPLTMKEFMRMKSELEAFRGKYGTEIDVSAYFAMNSSIIFRLYYGYHTVPADFTLDTFLRTMCKVIFELQTLLRGASSVKMMKQILTVLPLNRMVDELHIIQRCPGINCLNYSQEKVLTALSAFDLWSTLSDFLSFCTMANFQFVTCDDNFSSLSRKLNDVDDFESLDQDMIETGRIFAQSLDGNDNLLLTLSDGTLKRALEMGAAINCNRDIWYLVRDMKWFGEGLTHFSQEYENVSNILLFGDRSSFEMTLLDALDPVVRSISRLGGNNFVTLIDFLRYMRQMDRIFIAEDIELIQNHVSSIRQWFTDGLDDTAMIFKLFDCVLCTGVYVITSAGFYLEFHRDDKTRNELRGSDLVTFVNTLNLVKEENQKYSSHISTFIDVFCTLDKASTLIKTESSNKYSFPVASLRSTDAYIFLRDLLAESDQKYEELLGFQSKNISLLLLWEDELADAGEIIQSWIKAGHNLRDNNFFQAIQRKLMRLTAAPLNENEFWTFCSAEITSEMKYFNILDILLVKFVHIHTVGRELAFSGIHLHQIDDSTGPALINDMMLTIIQKIYGDRLPTQHEILDGTLKWSSRSLDIFLDRARFFPRSYMFTILNAQYLPGNQQERILQFFGRHSSITCNFHIIQHGESLLRSHTLLHEQLWDQSILVSSTSDLCLGPFIKHIEVLSSKVCGSGKTFYIREQAGSKQSMIHIHEKTDLASLISSLHRMRFPSDGGHLHFSLNIDRSEVSETILDMLNFFFQSMIMTFIVYDPVSKTFYPFDRSSWWIYLELPAMDNCEEWLLNHIPIIAKCAKFTSPSNLFRIDSKARRVCTYLRAYDDGTINRKFVKTSKVMLFVLDDSGSMQGEKINAAVDNMIDIFHSHAVVDDAIGLIRFCGSVDYYLPITRITNLHHKNEIAQHLRNARIGRWGGTQMYPALNEALTLIERHLSHSAHGCSWIVCLTDGESEEDGREAFENKIQVTGTDIQLVIVGVSLPSRYEGYIRRLCMKFGNEENSNFIPTTSDREAISRAFNRVANMIPVSQTFDLDGRLDDTTCRIYVEKYLPTFVNREDMMLIRVWIEFLYRRVKVFDENDDFNYNETYDELGSTLMTLMLQEVERLLKPDQSADQTDKCIIQVIYDFHDVTSPKFRLLATAPELIDPETRSCLVKLKLPGFFLPDIREINNRDTLDRYLSQALKVPLDKSGRLACIDKHKFVLTLDFTVKLISIHERVACGIPCVIEGETGVSKTALTKMYSHLINESIMTDAHALTLGCLLNVESLMIEEGIIETISTDNDVVNRLRLAIEASRPTIVQSSRSSQRLIQYLLDKCHDRESFYEDPPNKLYQDDSIDSAIRLLEWFSESHLEQTFFDLKIDSSVTEEDVEKYFTKVEKISKKIQGSGGSVVLFFDEFNTSSIMGFLKGIVIDRNIAGRSIPDNLIFICACNPHRATIYQGAYTRKMDLGQEWISGHYQVHDLPSSMNKLKWWYGALNAAQEKEFIFRRIQTLDDTVPPYIVGELTDIVSISQEMMRSLATESIAKAKLKFGVSDERIQQTPRSRSVVSLRDIQRVFTIYSFLSNEMCSILGKLCENDPQRYCILTVYIVYYLRLDRQSRDRFYEKLENFFNCRHQQDLHSFFKSVLDLFVTQLKIPAGIAITEGFKENIFMLIICALSYTPLIIIGPPGSTLTGNFISLFSWQSYLGAINLWSFVFLFFLCCIIIAR